MCSIVEGWVERSADGTNLQYGLDGGHTTAKETSEKPFENIWLKGWP
jgi:hypothetical protein